MLLERPGTGTSLWNPLQLHWHAPSEHTLDGELYLAKFAPALLFSAAYAASGVYNYLDNGQTWTDGVCASG
jgi:hypothetical protein